MTLAGNIVQGWAECLGGNVIVQLSNPGSPFIGGTALSGLDMRTTSVVYSSPESWLIEVATAQMAHFYQIPMFGLGGASDSKILDTQAMIEAGLTLAYGALSGQNLIHDLGFMGSGFIGSLELLAICDELVAMLKRTMKGIKVNDDTLALEAIMEAGYGGDFLKLKHTRRYFGELVIPELIDKSMYNRWKEKSGKTLEQRAHDKVKKMLEEHKVELIPGDLRKEIDKIIKA